MKRYFAYGNEIGTVDNKVFSVVEFDEEKFRQIIISLLASQKFYNPDLLLRGCIAEYVGAKLPQRIHQKKSISDSEFYAKWKKIIVQEYDFKNVAKAVIEANAEKRKALRKENEKARNVSPCCWGQKNRI